MKFLIAILASALIISVDCSVLLARGLTRSLRPAKNFNLPASIPSKRLMSSKKETTELKNLGLVTFGFGFLLYVTSAMVDKFNARLHGADDSLRKRFLKNGIDSNLKTGAGKAVELALSACFDAIVKDDQDEFEDKCLFSEFNINLRDARGVSALEFAIKNGKAAFVKELIANGADVFALGSNGNTFIQTTIDSDKFDLIPVLTASGLKVNDLDKIYNWYLSKAVESGNGKLIKIIAANGANVNSRSINGRQHLQNAIERGNMISVRALIAAGVDVNALDSREKTYLQGAIEHGNLKLMKILIAGGAKLNAYDNLDRSYLLTAAASRQKDAFDLLIARWIDFMSNEYARRNRG